MPRRSTTVTSAKNRIKKYRQGSYYVRGNKRWVDPYPEIHGTLPEKLVYARLSLMGIPFLFLNDISFSMPEIDFFKSYQADFIIPDLKIIIEVQGSKWHSTPQAIESDAFKLAVYTTFGYKALAWWDYDIESNLDALFASEPLLASAQRARPVTGASSELPVVKRTKIDTSKGIRTQNSKYKFKAYRRFVGTGRKSVRKVKSSYAT